MRLKNSYGADDGLVGNTWSTAIRKRTIEEADAAGDLPGSKPPRCISKCGQCIPCTPAEI